MCDSKVGVAKRIELEKISKDIADLVNQLDKEIEGDISVKDVKEIQSKLAKIIES